MINNKKYWLIILIFYSIFAVNDINAQVSMPNSINAYYTTEKIKTDGILNEAVWAKAKHICNFTQRETNNGQPVTERTEAAIIYTDHELHVGIWCYDSNPAGIVAKEMSRDFSYWYDDNFEIVLDTYSDKRNGYIFVVNPNGARADALTSNDGLSTNRDWNGIWDASAVINDSGWFAEVVIPFSTLKFSNDSLQFWGMNLERNIRRKQEQVFWQGWSRDYDFEHVSHAGTLILNNVSGKETLELKPFLMGGIDVGANQKLGKIDKIGGDLNYLITPTMKLNATVNTDFAQVESDALVSNLSRFSVYYPEKREFFLEGKSLFDFSFSGGSYMFYSRNIGINNGREIPILAGLRVLGREGNTNIGVISMQTADKDSINSANYSVVRIKQDIFKSSSIGGMFTSRITKGHENYTYGIDGNYGSAELFGDKKVNLYGNFSQTFTTDSINSDNSAFNVVLDYPNDFINFEAFYAQIGKHYNPETGFLQRINYKNFGSSLEIKPRIATVPFVQQFNFEPYNLDIYLTNTTNELESMNYTLVPFSCTFSGGDKISLDYSKNFDRLDDTFKLQNGFYIQAGKYWYDQYYVGFDSFRGRNFAASVSYTTGNYYDTRIDKYFTEIVLNCNKHLNFSFDFERNSLNFTNDKVGTLLSDNYSGRIDYSIDPKLSTSLYFQWNTLLEESILNFRLNWIPEVGSDFYLVVNQTFDKGEKELELKNTVVMAKLIWRFSY